MDPERSWRVCFQANFQRILSGGVGWKILSEIFKIASCNKKSQELEWHAVKIQPAQDGLAF